MTGLRARLAALEQEMRQPDPPRPWSSRDHYWADRIAALLREPPEAEPPTEDERAIEQLCVCLNDAHDEIVRLQGGDPTRYDWPEWSGPANSIRWAERRLGKPLSKAATRAAAPEEQQP
jgi:hypothetical protein